MPRVEKKVWNFFDKCNEAKKIATCNYCHRKLSYKTTVTNLKTHLKARHPEVYNNTFLSESESDPANVIYIAEFDDEEDIEELYVEDNDISKINNHNVSIWNYFQPSTNGDKTAFCNYCLREFSFRTTTTNLKSHLKQKHIAVYNEYLSLSRTLASNDSNNSMFQDDVTQSETEETYVENASSETKVLKCDPEIWDYFERSSSGKTALCNYCFRDITFDNSVKNLRLHLQTEHIEEYNKLDLSAPEPVLSNSSSLADDEEFLVKHVSSEIKKSRRSVLIWNFFEQCSDRSKTAICNYCGRRLSYRTTITNLKSHLQQKHIKVYKEFLRLSGMEHMNGSNTSSCLDKDHLDDDSNNHDNTNEPPRKYQKVVLTDSPKKINIDNQKNIDENLLKMITYDLQSFSIVNDIGFRAYTKALNSNYKIPDAKTLSVNLLPEIYENRLAELKQFVNINAKSVCLTVDCWTSCKKENYMNLTVHFITDDPVEIKSVLIECCEFDVSPSDTNIYNKIKQSTEKWRIHDKVNFIVTNNMPYLENTIIHFKTEDWSHFLCFAHKLNLVIKDALDSVIDTISRVETIVNYVLKNITVEENLFKYQTDRNNGTEPKTVIRTIPTIWNTMYLMLERFLELKEAIHATILKAKTNDPMIPMISVDEWKCVEQICIILKPFYEVTVEMSNDKYLCASKAFILTSNLINICNSYTGIQDLHHIARELAKKLKENIIDHLGSIETNDKIGLCTILDPRFKLKGIRNKDKIERLKNNIRKLLKEVNNENQVKYDETVSTSTADSITSSTRKLDVVPFGLWCEFDEDIKTSNDATPDELERYLVEPLIKRTECPLKYWQRYKCIYPALFKIFVQHCNIVVTSAPCEQMFSESGYRLSQRRTQLSGTSIAEIMFLNANKM